MAGLTNVYRSNSESGSWLRWSFGLTFLNPDEVAEASILLFSNSPVKIQKYCDYLFDVYIGEDAKFPPDVWAAFDSTTERTTNACESFHSNYNQEFSSPHPHIHAFTTVIQEIQEEVNIDIRSVNNKSSKDPKEELLLKCARRELLMLQYKEGDINLFEYVKKISKLFRPN